jgi:hypothetical protein
MKSMRAAADLVLIGISSTAAAIAKEIVVRPASSVTAPARRHSCLFMTHPLSENERSGNDPGRVARDYFKRLTRLSGRCDEAMRHGDELLAGGTKAPALEFPRDHPVGTR